MIRRDMRLPDGDPGWMLVSQVEHARVSADLAARCTVPLVSLQPGAGASSLLSELRDELLTAIRHHDDGWREWEAAPQFDATTGRPLAFTELDPADAVAIWTRSIDAAAAIGPVAAWCVAGHFLRLASHSEAAEESSAVHSWQRSTVERQARWFAAWQSQDPVQHTHALADRALEWLWSFDEASLWLCCTCLADEQIPCAPEPFTSGRGTPLEMHWEPAGAGAATAAPWQFDVDQIEVAVSGHAVPAAPYHSAHQLWAAAAPFTLNWRLASRRRPP